MRARGTLLAFLSPQGERKVIWLPPLSLPSYTASNPKGNSTQGHTCQCCRLSQISGTTAMRGPASPNELHNWIWIWTQISQVLTSIPHLTHFIILAVLLRMTERCKPSPIVWFSVAHFWMGQKAIFFCIPGDAKPILGTVHSTNAIESRGGMYHPTSTESWSCYHHHFFLTVLVNTAVSWRWKATWTLWLDGT